MKIQCKITEKYVIIQEIDYFCIQIESILKTNGILTVYKKTNRRFSAVFPLLLILMTAVTMSCSRRPAGNDTLPWGEAADTASSASGFDLDRIQSGGEMIMLTLSGPDTYYDYHGRHLGTHYLLCQRFADMLGVSLRVDVCRDTAEMLRKLAAGDGDVIACPLPKPDNGAGAAGGTAPQLIYCGAVTDSLRCQWAVSADKPLLAEALDDWYKPAFLAEVLREGSRMMGEGHVRRRVHAPMLDRKAGVISRYDGLFMTHCQPIRWDWRLMASQCYQESTFDPDARSWAGACGLMQIMPATADHLNLPQSRIYDPESNIAAAARYIGELEGKLKDIPDRNERINFILACYNGGYLHIRDAMALAARDGRDPHRWSDVAQYVLKLSEPRYYRDPLVKYGYMRGSETVDYVARIRQRWQSYEGVKGSHAGFSGMTPRKAKHRKKKYQI